MILSLFFVILIFAIAFLISTQGLFSALIMMVLTLCCAVASFGWYEYVSDQFVVPYLRPDFGHAVALGVCFGLPLTLLRLIFDKLIRRSCLLPAMIDRIGGGVCGLISSLVIVGVMAICIQMLPIGESILGYARFPVALSSSGQPLPDPRGDESDLWLKPDRFAASTASLLSSGVFNHGNYFYQVHPDLIQEAGWVNTVNPEISRYAKPQSISLVSSRPVEFVYRYTPGDERNNTAATYEPFSPEGSKRFQMIRVGLKQDARDARSNHNFTLRQFRLVGQEGVDGPVTQLFPIAIQQDDTSQTINRHIRFKNINGTDWPVIDELLTTRKGNNDEVEIIFEISKQFVPDFLEYKRSARINVKYSKEKPKPQKSSADQTTSVGSTPTQPASDTDSGSGSRRRSRNTRRSRSKNSGSDIRTGGGNVRGLAANATKSFFGDQLPVEMRSYRTRNNTEIRRGKLESGHLIGEFNLQSEGRDRKVSKFDVPRDSRLLHLDVGKLQSRSSLGRALSQAVSVAQNYAVEDRNGKQYRFVGKYAIAKVNNVNTIEIQYFPEQAGSIGGVGAFVKINESKLKSDDRLVLLFLVDPGMQIVSFSTGGDATRKDDLRSENLVAPQ